jgi:putative oxidoreductase
MERYLGRYSDVIYAALRIVSGFLFASHGAMRLFWGAGASELSATAGLLAGIIEFVGGSMIALGLLGSIAAFIASGEMAVAYFKAHAPLGLLPIVNFGDLAIMFCFVFLYIASRGSGRFSIDAILARRGNRSPH